MYRSDITHPLPPAPSSILLPFSEVIGVESLLFFVLHESHSYFYAYIVLNLRRASYDFVQW